MARARQVLDRPDVEAGRFEVDEELRQALVAVLVADRAGAAQRDHEMRLVRAAGPDLAAGDGEAALDCDGLGADRGEVRAAVGLAHADAEIALALDDARQHRLTLLLAAEAQDERPALAVGHPMRADRRARRQQLLGDDVALEEAPLLPAIFLGPGHADPAALAEAATELRRMALREI